jgi:hypothetical protein
VKEFSGLEQSTDYSQTVQITTEGESAALDWGVHVKFDWDRQGFGNPSKDDYPASSHQLDWNPVANNGLGVCTVR